MVVGSGVCLVLGWGVCLWLVWIFGVQGRLVLEVSGCNGVLIRHCIDGNGQVSVSIILSKGLGVVSVVLVVPLVVAYLSVPPRIVLLGFGVLGKRRVGRIL
jgi:hypothetical protein